jgi:hypothetical protein
MAILKNVELFYAKLDPKRPNATFDKENPTWEVQIRTRDKAQAKQWKELNINVKPDEDDKGMFYKATLKKKSKKRDGEPMAPVNIVAGDLSPIDPNTLGNGSKGHVRIYQYEYNVAGRKGIASMLMGVQVTVLNEYQSKPREDDFEITEFEVKKVADNQEVDEDQFVANDDLDDEINF